MSFRASNGVPANSCDTIKRSKRHNFILWQEKFVSCGMYNAEWNICYSEQGLHLQERVPTMPEPKSESAKSPIAGYVVGFGFLLTAGALAMMPPSVIPLHEMPQVRPEQIEPGAFRVALSDPPMISTGTFDQRCSDCHTLFENTRPPGRALQQHTEIKLSHGSNDGCLNCHDKGNREKLTLRGGGLVGYDQVEQLCAQCHGPVYRDWENGTHGKTLGYWDTSLGEAVKLSCTQCHDPHSPAYKPMPALPGPNTLRMGDHDSDHGSLADEKNPLQRWHFNEKSDADDAEHGGDH